MTHPLRPLALRPLAWLGLASLALGVLAPTAAHAYAAADAFALVRVTVQSIDNAGGNDPDTVVEIIAGTANDERSAFGNGLTATAGSVRSPLVDTPIGEGGVLLVQGTAAAAGDSGIGTALSRNSGFLTLFNASTTDTLFVDLLIEYAFALSAEVSDLAAGESAVADLLLEVTSDLLSSLLFNDSGLIAIASPLSGADSLLATIELPPGAEDYWAVSAVALVTVAAAPLPPAAALLAPGLLLLITRRRRTHAHSDAHQ